MAFASFLTENFDVMNLIYRLQWLFMKIRHPGIDQKLNEIRNEASLSPDGWRALRDERLRQLLAFAGNNSPYYRELFNRNGFSPESATLPDALERVPVLTKSIIQDHLDELKAQGRGSDAIENATGGSTGVPLTFYRDWNYIITATALDQYVREWWGIKPYDRTALIWGADKDFSELPLRERFADWRSPTKSLNAFRMSDESLLSFCRELARWRPRYLMGYATALEALAQCARRNRIKGLSFHAIRSTAETLWPHQRELIENALGGPVYDFYGSREVNNLVAECPEGRRLHVISAWRHIEIVDEEGHRVEDGVPGYITVTDMTNRAMPFIRYLNEDIGRMATERCDCGRPTPVVEQLLGRSTDLIRLPGGEIIHGEYFTHLFYGCEEISRFQVHQTALRHITVRVVASEATTAIRDIERRISERVGDDVNVELQLCDDIPVSSSGKYRFTLSDVTEADVKSCR